MKNNLIMITLLGVTFSIGASRAPEAAWADMPISNDVIQNYNKYLNDRLAGSEQGGNVEFDVMGLMNALNTNFNDSGVLDSEKFAPMIGAFIFDRLADTPMKDLKTTGDSFLLINDEKGNLVPGTLGEFTGKMCKYLMEKQPDAPALAKMNVYTRVALRNDGYRKEYFLGDTADTEKRDGMRHYFYSEPVKRPSGFLAMLGFGYTDKRSWGRYLTRKGLGLATIGGAAALGYYGGKAYSGRQPVQEEPLSKWENFKYRWFNPAMVPEREVTTTEGLKSIPSRIRGRSSAEQKAMWQEHDAGQLSTREGWRKVGRSRFFSPAGPEEQEANKNVWSTGDATGSDTRHRYNKWQERKENNAQAHKQIAEIKKQEKEALKEVNKLELPQPTQPGFFGRMLGYKSEQPINPMGSSFDIEGRMPIGTTAFRENKKREIKEQAKVEIDEVKRMYGLKK